jgi:RNA-directed DNA polymerase
MFERYADDIIVHGKSERQALWLKTAVIRRLAKCKLGLHPEKTKIVYCKDVDRTDNYPKESFNFLGFEFRPRGAKSRLGRYFASFLPAVSKKAAKLIRSVIRGWRLHRLSDKCLLDLSRMFNPIIRGWVNYYGSFYKSALYPLFDQLNRSLKRWAMRKYKRLRGRQRWAAYWLRRIRSQQPLLFLTGNWHRTLWPVDRSRMNREVHVRNCEGVGVKLPRATRLFLYPCHPSRQAPIPRCRFEPFFSRGRRLKGQLGSKSLVVPKVARLMSPRTGIYVIPPRPLT